MSTRLLQENVISQTLGRFTEDAIILPDGHRRAVSQYLVKRLLVVKANPGFAAAAAFEIESSGVQRLDFRDKPWASKGLPAWS